MFDRRKLIGTTRCAIVEGQAEAKALIGKRATSVQRVKLANDTRI